MGDRQGTEDDTFEVDVVLDGMRRDINDRSERLRPDHRGEQERTQDDERAGSKA
jgi:hypothetical protein